MFLGAQIIKLQLGSKIQTDDEKQEIEVLKTNDIQMTQELHVIRAHLLHFESLLQDFHKTVMFVKNTPNPRMLPRSNVLGDDDDDEVEKMKKRSRGMMDRECGNLLLEIERLERSRQMQEKRLKNVMDLVGGVIFVPKNFHFNCL